MKFIHALLVPLFFCCIAAFAAEPAQDAPKGNGAAEAKPELKEKIEDVIVRLREEYRAIPGKTGILNEEIHYSVGPEELIIRDFFQDRKGGVFLDVGCAWAENYNNTYYLEKNLGWTGIGVDALDDYAAEWASKRPASKFRNYLIASKSGGEGKFFKAASTGLSSTNEFLASGKVFGYDEKPVEVSVPMITLTDLLDKEGVTKVDLVSIDIEGYEMEALLGFDIDRFQPELLVIEGKSERVEKFLARHGYEEIERYAHLDKLNRYFQRTGNKTPPK